MDRATLLTLGQQTYTGLPAGTTAWRIVDQLAKQSIDKLVVHLTTVAAAEYLCPNLSPQALKVIGNALDS